MQFARLKKNLDIQLKEIKTDDTKKRCGIFCYESLHGETMMNNNGIEEPGELKRSLSLPLITFYGLGSIIGAGIYVLIGEVAGYSGLFTPFAFLIAAIIAAFTAFSYAELSSRFPHSAGEVIYIKQGLRSHWLSVAAGWLVVLMGILTSATLANGFVGYLQIFYYFPSWAVILVFVAVLGAVAVWGITESAIFATLITFVEIAGLILVVFIARKSLTMLPTHWHSLIPPMKLSAWSNIGLGAFIAFFAFIGFEDMVNVAEEVKNVRRTMPIAIILAVIISTLLYFFVAIVAVLAVPMKELAHNTAPLALIVTKSGYSPTLITLISLTATINGVLIQLILVSRVIYGMSKQDCAPKFLAVVNKKTQTPIRSTVLASIAILVLAIWFPLTTLAKASSYFILIMFSLVNLSLVFTKIRTPYFEGAVRYHIIIPIIATILCVGLLVFQVLV